MEKGSRQLLFSSASMTLFIRIHFDENESAKADLLFAQIKGLRKAFAPSKWLYRITDVIDGFAFWSLFCLKVTKTWDFPATPPQISFGKFP